MHRHPEPRPIAEPGDRERNTPHAKPQPPHRPDPHRQPAARAHRARRPALTRIGARRRAGLGADHPDDSRAGSPDLGPRRAGAGEGLRGRDLARQRNLRQRNLRQRHPRQRHPRRERARSAAARHPLARTLASTLGAERGSAPVEFLLVAILMTSLALAVIQLALGLHVRNTLLDAAAEGARQAALAGAEPADGVERTRQLISTAIADEFAQDVSVSRDEIDGVPVIEIRVRATLPLIGLIGIDQGLEVSGHAAIETLS
ncbi:pilus assembly protein [Agromyces archimandritae]|uniref:Pilus assembly protein n=1 Tax=Agromyces archimandritae TaxID=2781962 RepID=A0A975FLX3_9MICO|nr:pilus assembly protein [Agromyces archimandritae]